MATPRRLHYREADSIRVGDRPRRQALDPATRCGVMVSRRKVDRHGPTLIDAFQRSERGLNTGAEEGQAMGLGDDEIRREERDPAPERLSEQAVGVGVVLIAPAPQRDPGAAIDEQAGGNGGDAPGTGLAARQRRSR